MRQRDRGEVAVWRVALVLSMVVLALGIAVSVVHGRHNVQPIVLTIALLVHAGYARLIRARPHPWIGLAIVSGEVALAWFLLGWGTFASRRLPGDPRPAPDALAQGGPPVTVLIAGALLFVAALTRVADDRRSH